MKPCKFPERTGTLNKPIGWTDDKCGDLPVFMDGHECISLWRMTLLERLKALVTGKVWCRVYSGARTQPPVYLGTEYPFIITKEGKKK